MKSNIPFRSFGSEKGSALVGAVAFAIILFIASIGYLQVVAHTRNNEVTGYWDDRAFSAAESGLHLGARWLSQQNKFPDQASTPYSSLPVGGIPVTVTIVPVSIEEAIIMSVAAPAKLTYKKHLSLRVTPRGLGWYGTFLNAINSNWWQGGGKMGNVTFDGPCHFNTYIDLSAVSNTNSANSLTFNGRVAVHHTNSDTWDNEDGSHDDNDYDWGVEKQGAQNLNKIFQSQYRHHQDSLFLPRLINQDTTLPPGDIVINSDPMNPSIRRPYLLLNGNQATYYFWQGNTVSSSTIANINRKVIRVRNDLCVSGIINGQTTIVTDPGCNIFPVGTITYTGFNPDPSANYTNFNEKNNFGVPIASSAALALVSGKNIFFPAKWYNPTSGVIPVGSNYTDQVLYVNALLIAAEQGSAIRFMHDKNQEPKPKDYPSLNGIRVIGSRTLDQWEQFGPGNNSGDFFGFYFDRRLASMPLAPGIPGYLRVIDNNHNGMVLAPGTWTEKNIK